MVLTPVDADVLFSAIAKLDSQIDFAAVAEDLDVADVDSVYALFSSQNFCGADADHLVGGRTSSGS